MIIWMAGTRTWFLSFSILWTVTESPSCSVHSMNMRINAFGIQTNGVNFWLNRRIVWPIISMFLLLDAHWVIRPAFLAYGILFGFGCCLLAFASGYGILFAINLEMENCIRAHKCAVLCYQDEETLHHLLFKCKASLRIWKKYFPQS